MKNIKILLTILLFVYCHLAYAAPSYHFSYKLEGVDKGISDNINQRLAIYEAAHAPDNDQQLTLYRQQTIDEIQQAMQPFGYFQVQVHVDQTSQTKQNTTHINYHYRIIPGPQVNIAHISLHLKGKGKSDPELQHAIAHFALHQGDPLNIPQYETSINDVYHTAYHRGFLDFKTTTRSLKINRQTNKARIKITFKTGRRYHFGTIHFDDSTYDSSYLLRFAHFYPGEHYDTQQLYDFQQALESSHKFNFVMVEPELKKHLDPVPIIVHLTPKPSQSYLFGAGISNDGPRGTLGWDWLNVTTTGNSIHALAQVAQQNQFINLSYNIPGMNPITDRYTFSVTANNINNNLGKSKAAKAEASYETIWYKWRSKFGLTLLYEDTTNILDSPGSQIVMLYPSVLFSRTFAKDKINTHKGYRINVSVQATPDALSNRDGFIRADANFKAIQPLSENSRLIARGRAALLHTPNITLLPLSLQLYAGGSDSIRGYGRQEFGPGNTLLVGSAEIQHFFYHDWGIGVFGDIGNVKFWHDPMKFHKSVGIDLIRRTPVGPVILGLAKGLDDDDKSIRFFISLGPDL